MNDVTRPARPPAPRSPLRLDLNLFRVFDAIYTQGGISQAARVLHLSQPAVSHALKRLRDGFDDPLFVRQGNQMLPTETTRRVIGQVQAHLRGLTGVLHESRSFDPAALDLRFTVSVRDALESIIFPELMPHLAAQAPGVRLTSRRVPREDIERELAAGRLDLAIERRTRMGSRIRAQKLADETLVVVGPRAETPGTGGMVPSAARRPRLRRMSLSTYLAAHHVQVTLATDGADALDRHLADHGLERQVALRCQHHYAACQVVVRTGWLLTMPRTYALNLATVLPLNLYEPPFEAPPIAMQMYWHADRDEDPAHRWLRELLGAGAGRVMHGMNGRRSSSII